MSHNPHTAIACPNCGHEAEYNYCAKCGQPTHLHKDTFFALIIHFVAHYFHYDSKFWKTLKTLWFKPGALTIAYREKQRMRFIDPISLYIFVSAVFFLIFFSINASVFNSVNVKIGKAVPQEKYKTIEQLEAEERAEALRAIKANTGLTTAQKEMLIKKVQNPPKANFVQKRVNAATHKMKYNPDFRKEVASVVFHSIPKVVFFMIPIMAFILKLLFVRRKNAFFVDHGIFALHYHTFWFSIILLWYLLRPLPAVRNFYGYLTVFASMVYFVISMKKVYGISTRRSIFYSVIIGWSYSFFLLIVIFVSIYFIFFQMGA